MKMAALRAFLFAVTAGLLVRQACAFEAGVYYINACSNDAPCCLEGYLGVASSGELVFNLAGFTRICDSLLIGGFDECLGKAEEKTPGAMFGEVVIPHAAGPQKLQLTFMHEAVQIKNVGQIKVVASAMGSRMTSLEEGIKEGVVRDPIEIAKVRAIVESAMAHSERANVAVVIFSFMFVISIIYIVAGFAWVRRNGGTWDGPFRHIHAGYFQDCFQTTEIIARTSSSTVKERFGKSSTSLKEAFDSLRRSSSSSTMQNSQVELETTEEGLRIAVSVEHFGSGSPSKERRPKRDWSLFKPIQMSEDFRIQAFNTPTERQEATVVPSPERRRSLTHRTAVVIHDLSDKDLKGEIL